MLKEEAWGKRRSSEENIETARLGLVEHSMDVAAVFEALAALPSIRSRLDQLARVELSETTLARLCVLAFLHDIGKASVGFQSKAIPDHARAAWIAGVGIRSFQCGHTRVVAGLLFNSAIRKGMRERFPLDKMLQCRAPDIRNKKRMN